MKSINYKKNNHEMVTFIKNVKHEISLDFRFLYCITFMFRQ